MNYPRVTTVISPWTNFSKIPDATLQAAADRGILVHHKCARIAQGEFVMNINEDIRGYVESFSRWFDSQVSDVILTEERLEDVTWGYTGQIDLLVTAKSDGLIWLVDLKTSVMAYPQWKMQIAAYRNLVESKGFQPGRTGSLQLSPEGHLPKIKWYEDSKTEFAAFLSALSVYHYMNTE